MADASRALPLASVAPCTPAQSGIWHAMAESGLPPREPAHALCIDLHGDLDIAALQKGIDGLRERHDALRMDFADDGSAMRFDDAGDAIALALHDLRALPAAARQRRSECLVQEFRRQEFDLHAAPLLRACLLQLDADHHRLLLVMHRLAGDSRSLRQLACELGALYATAVGSADAVLLPDPSSFADHARRLAVSAGRDQPCWQATLRALAARPLPLQAAADRSSASLRLPDAAQSDVASTWLALLSALAGLRCGRPELLLAVQADSAQGQLPVGPCDEALPVRIAVDPDATLATHRLQADAVLSELAARAAPDVDALLAQLPLPAGAGWPLAPLWLRIRDERAPSPVFPGLRTTCSSLDDAGDAQLQLDVVLLPGTGIELRLCGQMPPDDARDWLASLQSLQAALVSAPDQRLGDIITVSPDLQDMKSTAAAGAIDRAPLAPDQARRWLRQRLQPGSAAGNHGIAFRLRGRLDSGRLQAALHTVLQRQGGLRIRIDSGADGVLQQCLVDVESAFADLSSAFADIDDVAGADELQRDRQLWRLMQEETTRPFAVDASPWWRLRLFRLAADEHVLQLVGHDTVMDAESFALVAAELAAACADDDRSAPLPELPLDFLDHAAWHAEWLQGADYAAQRERWRQRLAQWPPVPAVPVDHAVDAGIAPVVAGDRLQLPGWLSTRLQSLADDVNGRIGDVLLSAFAMLVARAGSSDAAIITVPMTLRDSQALQALVGPFTHWLPLRLAIDRSQTFTTLLRQSIDALADVAGDPDLQAEDLLLACDEAGHRAGAAQAAFCVRDLRALPVRWGSCDAEPLALRPMAIEQPLGLFCSIGEDGVGAELLYDEARFDAASIALLRDQYLSLLIALVDDPARSIGELLQPAAFERDRLIGRSIGRDVPDARADSLTARFRRTCADQPQSPAVIDGGNVTCYRQLSRAVATAAVRMREHVAVGDVLAIGLPPGSARIAAILAGLSVGALCLLLEPASAAATLASCLAHGVGGDGVRRRRWLVAEAALVRELRWPASRWLDPAMLRQCADSRGELLRSPCGSRLLLPRVAANGLVELQSLPERALLALDSGLREHELLGPQSRVAAAASPAHAHAVVEMLLPLLSGGAVVFDSHARSLDDWLQRHDVDTIVADSDAWAAVFARGWRGREGLTRIADGPPDGGDAEPASRTLLGRHFHAFGHPAAGIWSLFGSGGGPLRILPARRIDVLDPVGEPAAIGVYGRLQLSADAHDGGVPVIVNAGRARWRADGGLQTASAGDDEPTLAPTQVSCAPTTPLQALLHDLWSEAFGHRQFGIDDSFYSLGGQATLATHILELAAQQTGVRLRPDALQRAPDIRRLAAALAAAGSRVSDGELLPEALRGGAARPRSLVAIRGSRAGRPLFLVHGMTGSVMGYRVLARALPASVPVFGLQAAGIDGAEPPLASVADMADRYLQEIVAHQPQGPYRLGGTSIGGAVAFEIACRLRARGEHVELLALIDSRLPEPGRRSEGSGWLQALVSAARSGRRRGATLRSSMPLLTARLRHVGDRCLVLGAALLRRPLSPGLRSRELRRIHSRAWQAWRPTGYDGEITLFLASAAAGSGDPTLGWGALDGARVRVLAVGGCHHDVLARATLAAALGSVLADPVGSTTFQSRD